MEDLRPFRADAGCVDFMQDPRLLLEHVMSAV